MSMRLADVTAALQNWLHASGSATERYRIVIEVPTVDEEARLRLALKDEFENFAINWFDPDKPFRLMGFEIEFKWPK